MSYAKVLASKPRTVKRKTEPLPTVTAEQLWWTTVAPDAAAWAAPIVEDEPATIAERKGRESRLHVDHVRDLVPFWIREVEAAHRGETLRWEEFFERLHSGEWADGTREGISGWFNYVNGWDVAGDDDGGKWGWAGAKAGKDQGAQPGNGWGDEAGPGWGAGVAAGGWNQSAQSRGSVRGQGTHTESSELMSEKRNGKGRGRTTRPISSGISSSFVDRIASREAVDADRKRRMQDFFEMSTEDKLGKIYEMIRVLQAHPSPSS